MHEDLEKNEKTLFKISLHLKLVRWKILCK